MRDVQSVPLTLSQSSGDVTLIQRAFTTPTEVQVAGSRLTNVDVVVRGGRTFTLIPYVLIGAVAVGCEHNRRSPWPSVRGGLPRSRKGVVSNSRSQTSRIVALCGVGRNCVLVASGEVKSLVPRRQHRRGRSSVRCRDGEVSRAASVAVTARHGHRVNGVRSNLSQGTLQHLGRAVVDETASARVDARGSAVGGVGRLQLHIYNGSFFVGQVCEGRSRRSEVCIGERGNLGVCHRVAHKDRVRDILRRRDAAHDSTRIRHIPSSARRVISIGVRMTRSGSRRAAVVEVVVVGLLLGSEQGVLKVAVGALDIAEVHRRCGRLQEVNLGCREHTAGGVRGLDSEAELSAFLDRVGGACVENPRGAVVLQGRDRDEAELIDSNLYLYRVT